MKNQASLFAALLVSGALLAGCRAKNPFPGAENGDPMNAPVLPLPVPIDKPPVALPVLVVTARASKAEFKGDKPVELQIEVKNTSKKAVVLEFNSAQKFDFFATRETETETETDPIWSWGMNKRFAMMLSSQTLEAGKSMKFSANWDNAAPGRYRMSGIIMANGGLKSENFSVVVK